MMNEDNMLFIKEGTNKSRVPNKIFEEILRLGFVNRDAFSFVGVFYSSSNNITVIGYPKYLSYSGDNLTTEDKKKILSHMDLVCQAIELSKAGIRKSAVNENRFNPNNDEDNEASVNKYLLADYILMDYLKYGLYSKYTINHGKKAGGNINWNRTVNYTFPIIDRDVIYLDTINSYKEEMSNLITEIHGCIVNQCAKIMCTSEKYNNIELPNVNFNFNIETDLSTYAQMLLKNISYVFTNREIALFKALITWCSISKFYEKYIIGVTAFDRIWEYVNKEVFGNITNTALGTPSYHIKGKTYTAIGEEIPDILRVFQNKGEGYFCILDAKYYCIELVGKNNSIKGAPANSDIAKQVQYYYHLKQIYKNNDLGNIHFSNSFLVPNFIDSSDMLYEYIGYVDQSKEANMEVVDKIKDLLSEKKDGGKDAFVTIYQVDPTKVYRCFIKGQKTNDLEMIKNFIQLFTSLEPKK